MTFQKFCMEKNAGQMNRVMTKIQKKSKKLEVQILDSNFFDVIKIYQHFFLRQ